MKIELDLKNHCIKTEIKKLHEKAVSNCLKGRDTEKSELMVESLKSILEKNNLVKLRGIHKELSGKSDDVVILEISDNKRLIINSEKVIDLL